MLKKFVFGFAVAALTVLSAATSYTVTFYDPVVINGTALKPGDYKLELKENTAIISQGKTKAQAPVKVENGGTKYSTNTVRLNGTQVEEIRLGGTHTRVLFEKTGAATD